MKALIFLLNFLIFITLTPLSTSCFAESELTLSISPDIDISVERFPASGEYLIVFLAPEYGLRTNHRFMAQQLLGQQIEVWLSDIVESLYLPHGTKTLKDLDGQYVAALIDYAHKQTGKKVVVVGDSYAAVSVLRGAHQWQNNYYNPEVLIGAVLFSPSLFDHLPSLGLPPEFMPIASSTNIPIMIYQAQKNSNLTQLAELVEHLQKHNNPVYSKITPNIRSLFYTEESTQEITQTIKALAPNIKKMISVLDKHHFPDKAIPLQSTHVNISGIDHSIKAYKGNDTPGSIKLSDAYGNIFEKKNYKGQVTLVNFWATWCPPCVQEIPSLNRLKKRMEGLPFELISINYAEDKKTILDFMKEVNVEFPVLLDHNGDFAKKWNVMAYPSTFIISPEGKIKYGVNAAIEWDAPEVINKIKSLF